MKKHKQSNKKAVKRQPLADEDLERVSGGIRVAEGPSSSPVGHMTLPEAVSKPKSTSAPKPVHQADGFDSAVKSSKSLISLTRGAPGLSSAGAELVKAPYTQESARTAAPEMVLAGGRTRKSDSKYDGGFVAAGPLGGGQVWSSGTDWTNLSGIKPNNGKLASGKVLFVNGINITMAKQANSMQTIANATGHEVIGIHNGTQGLIPDVAECVTDKMNIGKNGSHKTLRDTVYRHVTTNPGQPLDIIAHSQGGIITSRALRDVKKLQLEHGYTPPASAECA